MYFIISFVPITFGLQFVQLRLLVHGPVVIDVVVVAGVGAVGRHGLALGVALLAARAVLVVRVVLKQIYR